MIMKIVPEGVGPEHGGRPVMADINDMSGVDFGLRCPRLVLWR
jgi:hypothetical protein